MSQEIEENKISGNLQRKRFFGFYSHRFAVLQGHHLNVYKDETKEKLEISMEISPETQIDIIGDEKDSRFKITQPNNDTETFECETTDLLMRWVLALRGCTFENPDISMAQFRILSVIGRGFYGKVMLCERVSTGEIVAIKTVHKSRLIHSNKVHTVIAERNILTRVHHPFIVSLRFAFQTAGKFYLGLEYAPGGELFYHMQKRGKLPLYDVRIYVAEICLALEHLHSNGIVYRDLKPENILLDAEGHIKLTDFGLSKDMNFARSTNTFCGTTEYLAPEIVKRESYGVAVDWWAVGILTYELLFGATPFAHPNRGKLFQNILEKEPTFQPGVPSEVLQFITAMLNKDPSKRPDFKQIKEMPFFNGMKFEDVYEKKYSPEFIPKITKVTSPTNFDKEFTTETPQDSYVMPVFGSAEKFAGFSYVDSRLGTPVDDNNLTPVEDSSSDSDLVGSPMLAPSSLHEELISVSPLPSSPLSPLPSSPLSPESPI